MERLYIEELQKILRYRDRRSVRRWCRNNMVKILSDNGSNKQFVLKEEFEKQKNRNYGLTDSNGKISLENHTYIYNNVGKGKKYRPQGETELAYLSIFTSL